MRSTRSRSNLVRQAALLLVLIGLVSPAAVRAQSQSQPPNPVREAAEVHAILEQAGAGQWIRILTRTGGRVQGRLQSFDTAKMRVESDAIMGSIALSSVDALWLKNRRTWTGALIGAGIGLGVGLAEGAALQAGCPEGENCDDSLWQMAAIGFAGGGVVGAIAGSALPEWKLVYGPVSEGQHEAKMAWPTPHTTEGGSVATVYGSVGRAASPDEGGPGGGPGGTIELIVALGSVFGIGPEIGIFDLGGDERLYQASAQARITTKGARARAFGLAAAGYYHWEFDPAAYGGSPSDDSSLNYAGFRVGAGGIYDIPRSVVSVAAELSYHSKIDDSGAARDLNLITGTIGAGFSW